MSKESITTKMKDPLKEDQDKTQLIKAVAEKGR